MPFQGHGHFGGAGDDRAFGQRLADRGDHVIAAANRVNGLAPQRPNSSDRLPRSSPEDGAVDGFLA